MLVSVPGLAYNKVNIQQASACMVLVLKLSAERRRNDSRMRPRRRRNLTDFKRDERLRGRWTLINSNSYVYMLLIIFKVIHILIKQS